jgi:predicted transcriptional regulator
MKRQTYDLAAEMLFLALSDVKKTTFIYTCNMSLKLRDKYLKILLKNRLMEQKGDCYHTTQKGIEFIQNYQKLECLWNTV